MLKKFWRDRPPTPVIMAWMVAGALALIALGSAAYGLAWLFFRVIL